MFNRLKIIKLPCVGSVYPILFENHLRMKGENNVRYLAFKLDLWHN